jgi:hypothetical protein
VQIDVDTSGADDFVHISGVAENQRVKVNGIEYTATGHARPPKFFRCVRDHDGDYWIEIDPGTSGQHWHLMRKDTIRKDTFGELSDRYGPLATD